MKTKYSWNYLIIFFGLLLTFTISCDKEDPVELPKINTSSVIDITTNTAKSGGKITDDGGASVTSRGVVWSTSDNPTVDNNIGKTTDGQGSGDFTSILSELSPGATYYVRAYATNSKGTSYGDQKEFTTEGELATVITAEIIDFTSTSAVSGGEVPDDGGLEVTARGIVWSTSENPDLDNNEGITEDGSGLGEFTSEMDNLQPATIYYVRAYAINIKGAAYGQQESFNTRETYALTLLVIPSGSGEVTGTGNYQEGEEVEITATAYEGHQFVNWTGDTEYIANVDAAGTTVTMPGKNVNLTANFDDDSGNGNDLTGEPCPGMTTFTDPRDGTVYNTVQIGDQCWLKENLKYLPDVSPSSAFSETDPHYYVYGYEGTNVSEAKATDNYQNYGVLYNWPAAMNGAGSSSANPSGVQGVCPAGWHLPSDAEWTQLVDYVVDQGYPIAANALKSCRQVNSPLGGECATSEHPRWNSNNTDYGTDQFGFSALPGGRRHYNDVFYFIGEIGTWWSSTEDSSPFAWCWGGSVYSVSYRWDYGFSVRCARD